MKENIKKAFVKIFAVLFLFSLSLIALPVVAQNCEIPCPPDTICIPNPLKHCMLDDFIYAITDFIFWVATAIAPLMIVIAGFYFVTSAGNPQQVQTAKKIILYTLIGYTIILLSRGLITVVKDIISGG
jgi:hypothetical protein